MLADATPIDFEQINARAFPDAPPLSQMSVGGIVSSILPYIFGAAGLALLIYLVMGGLQMMTSRGDPKAMQSAQAKITNALIGFVIVFFAFTFVQVVSEVLGLRGTLFSKIFGRP